MQEENLDERPIRTDREGGRRGRRIKEYICVFSS
jgi:hypothetical protein